jgi:hypothetical protein
LFCSRRFFAARPNIIVHLHVTPEESLERIKQRSRGCESGVSLEYLRALYTAYEEFIQARLTHPTLPNTTTVTPAQASGHRAFFFLACLQRRPFDLCHRFRYFSCVADAAPGFIPPLSLPTKDIARVIPVIKVDYSKFPTAGEMAAQIKTEYQRIQNIRFITFEDRAKEKRAKSPSFGMAVKENHSGGSEL